MQSDSNDQAPELDRNLVEKLASLDDNLLQRKSLQAPSSEEKHLAQYLYQVRKDLKQVFHTDTSPVLTIQEGLEHATINQGKDRQIALPPRLGRFDILELLGQGGFGSVYLAFDPLLKREVALKVPRSGVALTPSLKRRFLREGQAAAGLEHPNIVSVYEAGEVDETLYLASAYCSGPTLGNWVKSKQVEITEYEAVEIVAQLADAVHHAHVKGVLHRDLKPANVLLSPINPSSTANDKEAAVLPFTPKIIDFGLAKIMDAYLTETKSSVVLGTPIYMAPEQADGNSQHAGPESDIYSLGIILFELLTGKFPFEGDSAFAVIWAIIQHKPHHIGKFRKGVSKDLEKICQRCLEKNPLNRYATAAALAQDLRLFLKGESISTPKWPVLRRLHYWCGRPQRIFDAGLYSVVFNSAVILWMVMGFLQSTTHPELLNALPEAAGIILTMNGLLIWIGLKTMQGNRKALAAGLYLSVPPFLLVMVNFLGFANLFEVFWKDPLVRTNMFFLLTLLFGLQLVAYAIAAYASKKQAS